MTKYDVLGIGNAIVDVLAKIDDDFLKKHELEKGGMTLVDEKLSSDIYSDMPAAIEMSGGSGANTIAGLASFGANVAFIGKVKDDELGKIFTHDLRSLGVSYETQPITSGAQTASCLVCITPDAERTMATYLGATKEITTKDVDEGLIKDAEVTYLEGYLWDEPHAKAAIKNAMATAKKHNRKVAFTLSDKFCVDRHRKEFLELIDNYIDILFCNEEEVKSLFEENGLKTAVTNIMGKCEVVVVTLGEKGSLVISPSEEIMIDSIEDLDIVDLTGAGDLYAAGFLYAYTQNKGLKECGWLGTLAASEVIQHVGARPEVKLSTLLKSAA